MAYTQQILREHERLSRDNTNTDEGVIPKTFDCLCNSFLALNIIIQHECYAAKNIFCAIERSCAAFLTSIHDKGTA